MRFNHLFRRTEKYDIAIENRRAEIKFKHLAKNGVTQSTLHLGAIRFPYAGAGHVQIHTMKESFLIVFAAAMLPFLGWQPPTESASVRSADQSASVAVSLSALEPSPSAVHIAIYDDPEEFLDQPFRVLTLDTRAKTRVDTVLRLPPGEYAMAVFQDLNDNGELDKTFIGYPKEPFGFSRNFVPKFSAPSWSDTSFRTEERDALSIELIR